MLANASAGAFSVGGNVGHIAPLEQFEQATPLNRAVALTMGFTAVALKGPDLTSNKQRRSSRPKPPLHHA